MKGGQVHELVQKANTHGRATGHQADNKFLKRVAVFCGAFTGKELSNVESYLIKLRARDGGVGGKAVRYVRLQVDNAIAYNLGIT